MAVCVGCVWLSGSIHIRKFTHYCVYMCGKQVNHTHPTQPVVLCPRRWCMAAFFAPTGALWRPVAALALCQGGKGTPAPIQGGAPATGWGGTILQIRLF